jgi:hypothetical protein
MRRFHQNQRQKDRRGTWLVHSSRFAHLSARVGHRFYMCSGHTRNRYRDFSRDRAPVMKIRKPEDERRCNLLPFRQNESPVMTSDLLLHDHPWRRQFFNFANLHFVLFRGRIQTYKGIKELWTEFWIEPGQKMSRFIARATFVNSLFVRKN